MIARPRLQYGPRSARRGYLTHIHLKERPEIGRVALRLSGFRVLAGGDGKKVRRNQGIYSLGEMGKVARANSVQNYTYLCILVSIKLLPGGQTDRNCDTLSSCRRQKNTTP